MSGGLSRAGLTIGLDDLRGFLQFYGSMIGLFTSVLHSFSYRKHEEFLWAHVAVHKNLSSLTLGKVSEVLVGLVVETMIMCNMKNCAIAAEFSSS